MDLQQSDALRQNTRNQVKAFESGNWYHSIELPGGATLPGIVPVPQLRARFDSFGVPADLRGKSVLDIGAATGWCSFEAEKRGASVLAVDCVPFEELKMARELLGSRIAYEILDVEEITPSRVGSFDFVFFFGVLYHVRHPLLALENVCAVTRDTAFIESFVSDSSVGEPALQLKPTLEFYETDELAGQIDNWYGPSLSCLGALCRAAGFARVEFSHIHDRRGGFRAFRRFPGLPEFPAGGANNNRSPKLSSAVNNRTGDVYFSPHKDEYISAYFDFEGQIQPHDLFVEVDGFGVPLISVNSIGANAWQANLRRPSALAFGPHDLRVRTRETPLSEPAVFHVGDRPLEFAPDAPEAETPDLPQPEIVSVASNFTNSTEFTGSRHEYISCYFRLPSDSLARSAVHLEVGGVAVRDGLLLRLESDLWQFNARMPALDSGVSGDIPVAVVVYAHLRSAPASIRFRRS